MGDFMNYTSEDIINLVQSSRTRLSQEQTREVVIATNPIIDSNSRELYKEVNIKRSKYVSRSSEDLEAMTSSSLEEEHQKAFDNIVAPARTTTRITGISVQHARTTKGIKLSITIQTEPDAELGTYVELTAELKRHSRLRELRRYEPDNYCFQELYQATIEELKQLTPEQGQSVAMGRMHVRGARGHWFANMMAVANLDQEDHVAKVIIHVNGDEFEINMTEQLSPLQEKIYHTNGMYGRLTRAKPAPTLETATRKVFK